MSTIKDLYGIGEGGQVAPAKLIQWLLNPTFQQGTFDGVTIGGSQPGPATFTGVVVTTGGLSVLGGGVAVVGAFTATTLGIGSTISYTDTGILGTFASNTNSYNQVIAQNLNAGSVASSSFLASNNAGTATTNFVEMGINSSGFTGTGAFNQAGYSYLASASTDLVVGTYGANSIHFVVNNGATDAMTINGTTGAVNIPGSFSTSAINNTPIGSTTPSTGAFTTLSATTAIAVTSGGTGVTTSTGSGSNVLSTSPTLVTPLLGTPTSGVLTNCTGLPLTTGITGTLGVANGGTGVTTSTGTGSVVLSTSPTLVTPLLGTPTSGVLTNCTGLPLVTGITGTLGVANGGTGVTTSTGTGSVVLSTSPTLVTPLLGTPTSGNLANCTFPTLNQNTSGSAASLSAASALPNGTTATTQAAGNNSTNLATTAFASTLVGGTVTAASSLSGNGYQKFPSGLIMQWGAVACPSTGVGVTFPVTFPTTLYGIVIGAMGVGIPSNVWVTVQNSSTSTFNASSSAATPTAAWVAFGV